MSAAPISEDVLTLVALAHLPEDISALAKAAQGCRACPLWEHATQTVFGEGSTKPRMMLVGEQPGDQEDIEGRPFVGPAGKLLHACLHEAGVDEADIYVTNAVKHFKWKPSGNRRLHQKPNRSEILVCHSWLEAEIETLRPESILCLGVTASESVLKRPVKIAEMRGRLVGALAAPMVMVTVHPSSLLRIPDAEKRHAAKAAFVDDIKALTAFLRERRDGNRSRAFLD